jgi:hypothetical protein
VKEGMVSIAKVINGKADPQQNAVIKMSKFLRQKGEEIMTWYTQRCPCLPVIKKCIPLYRGMH